MMKNILYLLTDEMKKGFKAAGFDADSVDVSASNRPELCDFQCNSAFRLAKVYKMSPADIAGKIVEQIKGNAMFSDVAVAGNGFINLKLSDDFIVSILEQIKQAKNLGVIKENQSKTIVVDYGGANVAKALHVGHLRSAVIGESLKNLLRAKGHTVIGDVHLGDWGLQIGFVIEKLRIDQPELIYFDGKAYDDYPVEPPFDIKALTKLYTEANILSKQDDGFREKAAATTAQLQAGNASYIALWRHILAVSKVDLKANYSKLGVHFDLWLGESDSESAIPEVIKILEQQNLLVESKGAKVVYVEEPEDKKPIPPCILQKENGASLYATTDLGTLYQRMENYNPDQIIYVVDKRQELYFEQVFRVARKSDIVPKRTSLDFIGFGTMNGHDGKPFKTRDGGVMALEDLIVILEQSVEKKLKSQDRDYGQEEIKQTALAVGVAALKYADLSNQPEKNYVFDIERFSSFDGKTGPYVQYASVRAKSILNKLVAEGVSLDSIGLPQSAAERDLLIHIMMLDHWVSLAVNHLQPSKICEYVFDLAQRFNKLYHEVHIIGIADQQRKSELMTLVDLTCRTIDMCLSLLGIDALEKM